MADHGFDIENIPQGSTNLNIPPLIRTSLKTQFDEDELEETRCIASLHAHVEQAMERIKNCPITHYSLGLFALWLNHLYMCIFDCLHFMTSMV